MTEASWTSQKVNYQGVHIDLKQRIIFFDPKKYMVKLESSNLIHIYSLEGKP